MFYIFLVSRILFGGFFLYNAYNHLFKGSHMVAYAASKKVPMPRVAIFLSGLLILFGGAGILVGFYVPFAVTALVLFLVPVTLIMHDFWNETDPMVKATQRAMFAKNLALLGGALAYLFI